MTRLREPKRVILRSNLKRDKRIRRVSHVCDGVFCVALTIEFLVALFVVFLFLLYSCTPQQEGVFDQRHPIEDEPVAPPCQPTVSERDPCEQRSEFGFHGVIPLSKVLPDDPPTYEDIMFNSYGLVPNDEVDEDLLVAATHMVARGNFVAGSTNCEGHPFVLPEWAFGQDGSPYAGVPEGVAVQGIWDLHHWSCFTSFDVADYMVGDGPAMIAVMHPSFSLPYDVTVDSSLEEYAEELGSYRDALADAYEGYEWVLWLSPSPNTSVASWAAFHYWDVQEDADGTVRVVSPDYSHYDSLGATGSAVDRLNAPLSEFRRDIVSAHQSRLSMTSGRIGVATTTPDLVTSVEMLPDHFDEIGASDNPVATPVPPPARPLAPGELTAGSPSATGIPLSWSAPLISRVSGYKVVRRVPKGEFVTVVADTGSTVTAYTDTSAPMTAGVTYIYRVIALNQYGESLASNRATVELPGPDAPADFTATYSDGDVVLTWTQPGVIQPSCYRIYRRAQGEQSFQWVVYCWRPDLRSWTDDDVQSGTRYIYRIVPLIGTTESGATARASVRVP